MTEFGYIKAVYGRLRDLWGGKRVRRVDMTLVEEGLQQFPASASLWILRGMLLEFAATQPPYCDHYWRDSVLSFQQAVELNPSSARAWTQLAHASEAIEWPQEKTEAAFRQAIACGGGPEAYGDLACFLDQIGRPREADKVFATACRLYPGNSHLEYIRDVLDVSAGYC